MTPRPRSATGPLDLDDLAAEVVARTIEIGQVPAPTGHEQARAAMITQWWRDAGFAAVSRDDVGNCWAQARPGTGPAIILSAHLDTVFGIDTDHAVRRAADRLVGPSVGDDSVALAALPALGRLLASAEGPMPVLVLATVGEEGFGNLVGAHHAVAHPPVEVGAMIAIEGNYLGRLGTVGVGSQRWHVEVSGRGGHAWEQSEAPSAAHVVAGLVHALSMVPTVSRTTSLNVGRLGGGEAINARARQGWFDLELRGADLAALDELEAKARAVLEGPVGAEMNVKVTDVGRRPAGRISPEHPLVVAAREALQARAIPWRQVASSTDANAAHAVGLPAVALGVTYGANEHTPQEWVEILPIADGLAALADTVVRYEHLKLSPTARRSSARPPSAARSRGEGEGP